MNRVRRGLWLVGSALTGQPGASLRGLAAPGRASSSDARRGRWLYECRPMRAASSGGSSGTHRDTSSTARRRVALRGPNWSTTTAARWPPRSCGARPERDDIPGPSRGTSAVAGVLSGVTTVQRITPRAWRRVRSRSAPPSVAYAAEYVFLRKREPREAPCVAISDAPNFSRRPPGTRSGRRRSSSSAAERPPDPQGQPGQSTARWTR